jgi:hypothetical protein
MFEKRRAPAAAGDLTLMPPAPADLVRAFDALHEKARVNRRALLAAVAVIKSWHGRGAGLGPSSIELGWHLYWRNSPEMAAIREALAGVDLDKPEKLL